MLILVPVETLQQFQHHKPPAEPLFQPPPTRNLNDLRVPTHTKFLKNKLSSRAPMVVHILEEALLKFQYHKPALEVLFQLPPTRAKKPISS